MAPERAGIGFHAEPAMKAARRDEHNLFEETHPDDLRHFGLIPEFIGRFPVITDLHDLDEADLVRILTEPRNALVRQYQQLFAFEGVLLEFTPDALSGIAGKAIERGSGARGLRSVLEALLKRTMFDLPSMTDITKCRIDKDAVLGESEIHLEQGPEGEDELERAVG